MSTPFITVTALSKKFPHAEGKKSVAALSDVNLTVSQGEFLLLLGPSGCGKSTLLRIMSGLDHHTKGSLHFHKNYDQTKCSFVFQNFGILPWLTVTQNIALNLIGAHIPLAEQKQAITKIIEAFGLTAFSTRYPHELSGGMKQRVGLARAFVSNPEIIFLDEPFSELDFFTAQTLRELLLHLWKDRQTTVVMVSHYINEAVLLADRIAVFSERPGRIKVVLENTLARPRNPRSAEFYELEDTILAHLDSAK